MNKKELKSLIKEMVRESLTEIFVEMKLENIVENVVRSHSPRVVEATPAKTYQPFTEEEYEKPQRQQPRQNIRENLRSKLAVSDNEWKNIYEDVDTERLPPSGASTTIENPEFVSDDDMRKLGLL
jgi:hypothetical protein